MTNVIVAVPDADDPVWKISSEKVPHMTLLFLDNILEDEGVGRVWQYIAHAANNLNPFYLDVTSRGILGSDEADVVFFNPKYTKKLEEFRSQLLADPVIAKAYLSVEQYPQWTPHLTLGYPENPAKKTKEPLDPKIWGVRFNRIALWTDEYAGPEFLLPEHEYSVEEVAMSDKTELLLAHYGIKGMRWGKRKSEGSSAVEVSTTTAPGKKVVAKGGQNHPAADDAIRVASYKQKAKASTTDALQTKELQELVNRMNLEQQYSRLTETKGFFDKIDNDKKKVDKLLAAGQTANNVATFLNSPIGKGLKAIVKAKLRS